MSAPDLRTALRVALMLLGLGAIAWLAWANRVAFGAMLRSVEPTTFVLAIAMGVVFTTTQGALYALLMRKHGEHVSPRLLVAAFLVSQPGKYVPGNIWMPLMQSMALGNERRLVEVAIANVELAAVGILQMTTLGLALLWRDSTTAVVSALVGGTGACILVLRYDWVSGAARSVPFLARRLKPCADSHARRLPVIHLLVTCLVSLAANLAASWLVLHAAGPTVPRGIHVPMLATLYLGFAAGLLAVPVPAGVGVREVATIGLGRVLAASIPAPLMASVVLLARAWQFAVDAACFALGLLLLSFRRRD